MLMPATTWLLCMGLFSMFLYFAPCEAAVPGRLTRTQPDACAQKLLRVDGVAVDPGFIMQMRTRGAAGRADGADHLADPDDIADLDVDLRKMAVAGRQPVAV